MNIPFRTLVGLLFFVSSTPASFAAISFTGEPIIENFDTLPNSTTNDYYGVNTFGVQTTVPGTSGWEGTQLSGSTTNGMDLVAFTVAGTSSGTVGSAGQGTLAAGTNERGIAILASGSWTPAMGVEIVNNSQFPLKTLSINFTQELWRSPGDDSAGTTPGVVNTVAASWGTTNSGVVSANFLSTTTGFTPVPALNLVSPAPASSTADPVDLDGNLLVNQVNRSATLDFTASPIGVGQSFFLRFQDFDDPGRDATFAIDDITFSVPGLSLSVDRITGGVTLSNSPLAGGTVQIQGYSILSSLGALNQAGWKSIANHSDENSGSSVDPDDVWTILSSPSSTSDLSEFQFGGTPGNGASLAPGQSIVLSKGDGAWIPTPNEKDLAMMITTSSGDEIEIPIQYTGNNGEALLRSDFNHDGFITTADYDIFKLYNHTNLSGLSLAQQYVRGDLDGDGDTDGRDFNLFKSDYEDANGQGSFANLINGVPEPSSFLLLAFFIAGTAFYRSRKVFSLSLFLSMLLIQIPAYAMNLDFGSFTAEGIAGNSAATWNSTSSTANLGTSNARGNVFYGTDSLLGKRVIGTFNPGTDDDFVGFVLGFNPNDGTNLGANYLLLDWKGLTQENDYTGTPVNDATPGQTAYAGLAISRVNGVPGDDEIWGHVSLVENPDGGVTELARASTLGTSSYPINSEISFEVTYSASNVSVWINDKKEFDLDGSFADGRFGLYTSSQANPVSYSNFGMFAMNDTLTAIVNRTNGDITLKNNSASSISFDYYELTSGSNSLDANNWNSLDAQGIGNGPGNGNNWDVSEGSTSAILAESFLLGNTTLAPGAQLVLQDAYNTTTDQMDINLLFHNSVSDFFIHGLTEYVVGGSENADFDNDGDVDGSDFLAWQAGFGAAGGPAQGDANGDGNVNAADLAVWKNQYGSNGGGGSLASAAVPEQSAFVLLVIAVLAGAAHFRRRGIAFAV